MFLRTKTSLAIVLFAALSAAANADDYSDVAQLTRDGKFSEALTRADTFILSKPRDAQMRFLKGVAQRDAGKTSDAIATFTRLTEDFPELPEPHNNLGVLYAEQNQIDKARVAFEAALRTHPSYAAAHDNLGDIYAKLSSAAYSKALQLEGNSAVVAPKLALARQLIGPGQPKVVLLAAAKPDAALPLPAPTSVPAATPVAAPTPASAAAHAVASSAAVPLKRAAPTGEPPAQNNKGAADAAVRNVETAVQNWVAAWSNKDLKGYFNAYGKDFSPSNGASRSTWEAERRARIEGKSKISVRLEGLQVAVNGNRATVKFRQDYRANGIAIASRKTLELAKQGDSWKIVREAVGGA